MVLSRLSDLQVNETCCHPSCLQAVYNSHLVLTLTNCQLTSHDEDMISARNHITSLSWHNTSVRYHGYHISQLFSYTISMIDYISSWLQSWTASQTSWTASNNMLNKAIIKMIRWAMLTSQLADELYFIV